MRKSLLLMSAAMLGLSVPAMAQDTTTTQSPPAPAASQSEPQPANSLPPGGATSTQTLPGDASPPPATPSAGTPAASGNQGDMTGMRPMQHPHNRMAHRHMMNHHAGQITRATGAGPGEPESYHASNIDRGNTHSDIAPALPMPPVRGNSPEDYLTAADRALAHHQSGAAQEALERAETRLLDRSVPAGEGNTPMQDPRLTQIRDARMAIANRDWGAARNNIQQAMNTHMSPSQMSPPGTMPAGMAPPPGMGQGSTGTPPAMQPPGPPPPPGTGVPQ